MDGEEPMNVEDEEIMDAEAVVGSGSEEEYEDLDDSDDDDDDEDASGSGGSDDDDESGAIVLGGETAQEKKKKLKKKTSSKKDKKEVEGGEGTSSSSAAKKSKTKKAYLPGMQIKDGETLVCDESAYVTLHTFTTAAPCLSFDVIPDGLGPDRNGYPLTSYLVSGTQAQRSHANNLIVMKVSESRE
jgi:hypothetical protein